jgi:hypothetical protein
VRGMSLVRLCATVCMALNVSASLARLRQLSDVLRTSRKVVCGSFVTMPPRSGSRHAAISGLARAACRIDALSAASV